jgi:hypothetical protein
LSEIWKLLVGSNCVSFSPYDAPEDATMSDGRISVVATEIILALAVTVSAWLLRHRRPGVFWLFPLIGATWAALAHGVYFYNGPGDVDPGGLAGFGIASALCFGLPAGFLAFGVARVWWEWNRKMKPQE